MHLMRSSMVPFTKKFFSDRLFGVAGIGTSEEFHSLWSSIFIFSHLTLLVENSPTLLNAQFRACTVRREVNRYQKATAYGEAAR